MTRMPQQVGAFLQAKRIAVAGVSRTGGVGNAIVDKLAAAGFEPLPVNPHAAAIAGRPCYPNVGAIDGPLEAVIFASHPRYAPRFVEDCRERGVKRIWFHRSFGEGSVSAAAVRACEEAGIEAIVGGCPLMYLEPVDLGHRCMCWLLRRRGRVPS
jgi:predicted CoA-binding protein